MEIRMAKGQEREAVFALRVEVFVKEQNVPAELELDAEDAHALHIIAEEEGHVLGCARLLVSEREAHIGRLAVKRTHRGMGIGSAVCRFIIAYCGEKGFSRVWLNSQLHAVGFYETLGFEKKGEVFMEAGIPHIEMDISLNPQKE